VFEIRLNARRIASPNNTENGQASLEMQKCRLCAKYGSQRQIERIGLKTNHFGVDVLIAQTSEPVELLAVRALAASVARMSFRRRRVPFSSANEAIICGARADQSLNTRFRSNRTQSY
jgi:hypothetical protein